MTKTPRTRALELPTPPDDPPGPTTDAGGRRPPGTPAVEQALRRVSADPLALESAAAQLHPLERYAVRERVRLDWVDPGYEQMWRALARAAPVPVRRHCLEFAAACRWGGR